MACNMSEKGDERVLYLPRTAGVMMGATPSYSRPIGWRRRLFLIPPLVALPRRSPSLHLLHPHAYICIDIIGGYESSPLAEISLIEITAGGPNHPDKSPFSPFFFSSRHLQTGPPALYEIQFNI
ncbi:hypothetical protein OUZ56_009343 [Daphnia magna]|uniref:Uncharacterized protein n=1 Tax=Daphnia magna TaxID=35525 RepID=A0ABR0AFY8_9CRUS|nr:hypothetical protein OUZ56_009343 [Daphnia magna]